MTGLRVTRLYYRCIISVLLLCALTFMCNYYILPMILNNSLPPIQNYDLAATTSGSAKIVNVEKMTKFVSLCRSRRTGNHGIGNHLFMFAAVMFVAQKTGREVAMPADGTWLLDRVFDVDVERVKSDEKLCPCVGYSMPFFNYDRRFDQQSEVDRLVPNGNRTIVLCELGQTYRYAAAIETSLRARLRLRYEVSERAKRFLEATKSASSGNFVRVGVHVRRGDFLDEGNVASGLTVVNRKYILHAMEYFKSQHSHVQFVVATDDWKWTKENLPDFRGDPNVVTTYSENHTAGVDFAILTMCDATIVSTGSFGWWAAWIANKTTVYYEDWPREGSRFSTELEKSGYFPPNWIPMK